MNTQDIRRQFLKYFKDKHHSIIASSPVVPHDDPTLLFINAGMNQFKDVFLGKTHRDYQRAASSQKCIRVGGKHNDLENVGHTRRHLTFFEMLGNFSFGDYFKEEAIRFAWEVSTEIFGFEPERIWPSVFLNDDEAFEIWTKYVPASRITRLGEKDNFWAMGDTGPCGPCSELYYDRGSKYGSAQTLADDADGDRFLEFWNLVFMQFNRQPNGEMDPLPKPSIDTGSGLERVISLKMNVDSVFETDVLRGLIAEVETITGIKYDPADARSAAFRVIADHLRCLSFAIADGVQPSNVDRGYVLRKVLRRAVRYGRSLGIDEPFLAKVLPRLVSSMGNDYAELKKGEGRISEILTLEEEAFIRTLRRGGNILNSIMERAKEHQKISGDDAFKLKDTYGLPIDEILLLAKDAGMDVDQSRYQDLENEARQRSRSVHKTTQQVAQQNQFADYLAKQGPCEFLGYGQVKATSKVTAIVVKGEFVSTIQAGEEGEIVLDNTPFYAEMGGQIGDSGTLSKSNEIFNVLDTQSPYKGVTVHVGKMEKGSLKVGDTVQAAIDPSRRQKIANNHTATHLLHWALHRVLGEHIKQAGSVVEPTRLRFDFSHHKPLTNEEIFQIEDLVNRKIRENTPVKWYEIPYEIAQKNGDIKQFFGEKYGNTVRVIDIDFSKELCGGTHTSALGTIGLFRIAKESSIAAGMRRIEALTGEEAEQLNREDFKLILKLADTLKTQPLKLLERVEKLTEENKELAALSKNARKGEIGNLVEASLKKVEVVNQIPLLSIALNLQGDEIRFFADEVMNKLSSGVLVIGATSHDKCQLLVRVSDDLIGKGANALEIIKKIAPIVEGSGGGKANSAQAGGKAPHKLKEALDRVRELF